MQDDAEVMGEASGTPWSYIVKDGSGGNLRRSRRSLVHTQHQHSADKSTSKVDVDPGQSLPASATPKKSSYGCVLKPREVLDL